MKQRKAITKVGGIFNTCIKSCKAFLRHGLFDVLVLSILSVLLSVTLDFSWAEPSSLFSLHGEKGFSTETFFKIKNQQAPVDTTNFFVLADIGSITNRAQIAQYIDSIYALNPRKIAIDLIFVSSQDSIADSKLRKSILNTRDKSVYACMLHDYNPASNSFDSITHSIFLDPHSILYCDSVEECYANMKNDGTSDLVWKYSLCENYKNERFYSLPAKLLSLDTDEPAHTEHIINYSKTFFPIIKPGNLTREAVEDNYVIVGAYQYSGDLFETPLGLIPGMLVHSYIMQSELSEGIEEQTNAGFIMMTIVSIMMFVAFMLLFDFLLEHIPSKALVFLLQGTVMSIGLSIVAVYLLMRYCYGLFIDDLVFSNGQAALKGMLVVTALVKVLYATLVIWFTRRKICNRITSLSIYHSFKICKL